MPQLKNFWDISALLERDLQDYLVDNDDLPALSTNIIDYLKDKLDKDTINEDLRAILFPEENDLFNDFLKKQMGFTNNHKAQEQAKISITFRKLAALNFLLKNDDIMQKIEGDLVLALSICAIYKNLIKDIKDFNKKYESILTKLRFLEQGDNVVNKLNILFQIGVPVISLFSFLCLAYQLYTRSDIYESVKDAKYWRNLVSILMLVNMVTIVPIKLGIQYFRNSSNNQLGTATIDTKTLLPAQAQRFFNEVKNKRNQSGEKNLANELGGDELKPSLA